jgi:hypothetical protein
MILQGSRGEGRRFIGPLWIYARVPIEGPSHRLRAWA